MTNKLNNKGFMSMSLVYSFFILFIAIMLALLASYAHNRVLLTNVNEDVYGAVEGGDYLLTILGTNGTVTKRSTKIKNGFTRIFSLEPDEGYFANGTLTCPDVDYYVTEDAKLVVSAKEYTAVKGDMECVFYFQEMDKYNLSIISSGGSITPAVASVYAYFRQNFNLVPNTGYKINPTGLSCAGVDYSVDGDVLSVNNMSKEILGANLNCSYAFSQRPRYTIRIQTTGGGGNINGSTNFTTTQYNVFSVTYNMGIYSNYSLNPNGLSCSYENGSTDEVPITASYNGSTINIYTTDEISGNVNCTYNYSYTPPLTTYFMNNYSTFGMHYHTTCPWYCFYTYNFNGINPNNYILFNDELWRIINVEYSHNGSSYEYKTRIIRNDYIASADYLEGTYLSLEDRGWVQSEYYKFLQDYLNSTGDTIVTTNSYPRISGYSGINPIGDYKSYLYNAAWWTGEMLLENSWNLYNTMYYERSTSMYKSHSYTGYYFNGYIGTLYTSDYFLTSSVNKGTNNYTTKDLQDLAILNTGPLANSTFLPTTNNYGGQKPGSIAMFHFYNHDRPYNLPSSDSVTSGGWIYPTVYLKPSVKLVGGTGTIDDPYRISL